MSDLHLRITLLSDGEPGSGFGTEAVDALVPRDAAGRPCLPASHLKGLLRERLMEMAALRGWSETLQSELLGEPGSAGDDGQSGRLVLADAVADADVVMSPLTITRTAVSELGTAEPGSLRTVEAIPAGTCFATRARLDVEPGDVLDDAVRLGLMSIEALGGGRTRGAGRCRISITGEDRTPGQILKHVDKRLHEWASPTRRPRSRVAGHSLSEGPPRWFRLVFRAESPVCCPELPTVGSNVMCPCGSGA